MSQINHSVIIAAKRTPVGKRNGMFKNLTAIDLGAEAIKAVLDGMPYPEEAIIGNYASAYERGEEIFLRQNPAKEALIKADFGGVNASTVNKVCSSGLKAIIDADRTIRCGDAKVILAGGMESMTEFSKKTIKRLLSDPFIGKMTWDAGEWCARDRLVSRKEQDDWAAESYKRARHANKTGLFAPHWSPAKMERIDKYFDEEPTCAVDENSIRTAEPIKEGFTITPLNASKNADGAAMVVLIDENTAKKEYGMRPLARILSSAQFSFSGDDKYFTIAPPPAICQALEKAKLQVEDIGLFEINAPFASVLLNTAHCLNLPLENVNVLGDSIALGHPIGATGAVLMVKAVYALEHFEKRYAVICLCNALGEATAMVIENGGYL